MKKLMIIAAVVMAVVGAKAAAVDWSASAVLDPWATAEAGKNTGANGWLGYMVLSSDYSKVVADLADGNTASLLASAVGPVKQSSNKGAFAASAASGTVAAGEKSFYLIVLNNSDASKATHYYTSAEVSKEVDASLDTLVTFGSQSAASKNVDNWTAMAPEPTSGLLLLIGVAGLALRRRRRA